jgi:hypothetical protein
VVGAIGDLLCRPDRAEEYGRLNGGEGMILVRLNPQHIVSENNISGD